MGVLRLIKLYMRMTYYSVMTQVNSQKEIPSAPITSRTHDLPITGLDALPLSHRESRGTLGFKQDSWDKHPAVVVLNQDKSRNISL